MTVTASHVRSRASGYTVYNLTVEGDHTYFVGTIAGGVWVHNSLPCDLRALRQEYVDAVLALRNVLEELRAEGEDWETIAKKLNADRRDLGIKYKDMTPPDELARITARNIKRYKDPLGPTIQWFLEEKHYSWEQIAESACKPGGKDLGF